MQAIKLERPIVFDDLNNDSYKNQFKFKNKSGTCK